MAVGVGFEPTLGYKPKLAFEASAINRSATQPLNLQNPRWRVINPGAKKKPPVTPAVKRNRQVPPPHEYPSQP